MNFQTAEQTVHESNFLKRKAYSIWGACLVLTLVLYGRSLPYKFVYDDHWRILLNPAIKTLHNPKRFFLDAGTQTGFPHLSEHTFRPLVTTWFALDYAWWGPHPFFYPLGNFNLPSC